MPAPTRRARGCTARARISVYANQASLIANFYLAQVAPTYAGKQMVINLWDPGEGGNNIQIISPVGPAGGLQLVHRERPYGFNVTSLVAARAPSRAEPKQPSKFNDRKCDHDRAART